MVKFYSVLLLIGFFTAAQGQKFSMGDLVNLTSYNPSKFDSYVSRRGFRPASEFSNAASEGITYNYFDKKAKIAYPENFIAKYDNEAASKICFQTASEEEFNKLNAQFKEEFHYTDLESDALAKGIVYQKGNLTITPTVKNDGDKKVYSFLVERKELPKAKDVVFAEDLLQFTSHEYLASAFGEANVKRDYFYFSEKELNKCSVLFPNTNMQVIFIWKDETNLKDISFILIGGQLRAQSSLNYHKQIELNSWQSKQGIRAGMSLKELQLMNGEGLNFYGWETDQPGVLANKNKGNLDFKNLSLVFNCLDCNEDKFYSNTDILSSDEVLKENRRIYVSTIVLLPTKK